MKIKLLILFCAAYGLMSAQTNHMQYLRPNNQEGLNMFETSKNDPTPYDGLRVQVGGGFTQDWQALNHQNTADEVLVGSVNKNKLVHLTNGFNLAMANLNIDAQLDDGVRLNLTLYLSSRHHQETWVKGGYIQFDKLPFIKSDLVDNLMKNLTIKIGDYEVDYGDAHYRRTDGGSAIYNPFVENYIMDEFATEIGGEVYYHTQSGFMAMVGMSNGQLNPTVVKSSTTDAATGEIGKYSPAYHGKLAYDKQLNEDLRFRLSGSFYVIKSSSSNTLFGGDRTGSHYFFVMENTAATSLAQAKSGRFNPSFSQEVSTFMVNPFVKYKGLELFGTYELAKGRKINEVTNRTASQYAVDLIYRFPEGKENFWIGGRYNSVTAELPGVTNDVTIQRLAGSVGWFLTKNMMLKAEYVSQQYKDYVSTDILSGGKFNGLMVEASIGF